MCKYCIQIAEERGDNVECIEAIISRFISLREADNVYAIQVIEEQHE